MGSRWMPDNEISDKTYSQWHMPKSIERYLDPPEAKKLADGLRMIDADLIYYEFDRDKRVVLGFIELVQDDGSGTWKPAWITRSLAEYRTIPSFAWMLKYTISNKLNPASPSWFDIESFRARRLWPNEEAAPRFFSPEEWAKTLVTCRNWALKGYDHWVALGYKKIHEVYRRDTKIAIPHITSESWEWQRFIRSLQGLPSSGKK